MAYEVTKYSENWLSVQTAQPMPKEKLNEMLLVLQTAFPTVVRGYDQMEFKNLQSLWYDVFKNVPEELMSEAIRRFIINDRKGFFPSPGQIVGYIEQIVNEQNAQRWREDLMREQEQQRAAEKEDERALAAGIKCENCLYCRHVNALQMVDTYTGKVIAELEPKRYFCTNPNSRKYEGSDEYKRTTSPAERCECFTERAQEILCGNGGD